jgi:hypothetical protein
MSEYKSSNVLQNSVYSWTFSKSYRFDGSIYRKPLTDSIYNIPDKKTHRTTSMGYGKRYDLLPLEGRISPPPNSYNIKSCFEINAKERKGNSISDKYPPQVNILI